MRAFNFLSSLSVVTVVFAATPTNVTAATCVTSTASSTNTATWTVGYAEVDAPVTGTGYDIDASFVTANAFNNSMCQFACNGNQGCVSFFGRFIDVNTDEESYECLSFKTLLDDSAFTTSTANIAVGAFNKLC
ncbi:hypothetical protein BD289DRAFT_6506 [Coniella lustricola]|uniref:Apple domain-containing protein n=1 Tax=Coniella lustricola TaxID=2025994 RepID=A0A2T3AJI4_9PEZI|nr:hypothetical protein BD289DRAFT_6506 [Coniella lustricola]